MSKKKGTFRDKIDSILAEGGVAPDPEEESIAPLRARVDAILAGADENAPAAPDDEALSRLLAPTTETKLDEIELSRITGRGRRPTGKKFEELKASISERGVIQPVLLRPSGDGYEVVDGAKRLAAARALNLVAIPAVVRELSDEDAQVTAGGADIESDEVTADVPPPVAKPARRPAAAKAAARRAAVPPVVVAEPVPTFGDEPAGSIEADVPEAAPSRSDETTRVAAASALHPTRDDRDQFRLAAASATAEPQPVGGQAMLQWYLFLFAVAFASFAFFSFVQWGDSTAGIQGGVLGGLVLAVILFLMAWRRS